MPTINMQQPSQNSLMRTTGLLRVGKDCQQYNMSIADTSYLQAARCVWGMCSIARALVIQLNWQLDMYTLQCISLTIFTFTNEARFAHEHRAHNIMLHSASRHGRWAWPTKI